MSLTDALSLYRELQQYVDWSDDDAERVRACGRMLEPCIAGLIDDFYDEIERHTATRMVITGGTAQIARLKQTLRDWLRDLLAGDYNQDYVERRWRVGLKHVDIGLSQVYTNVALSRLRLGLLQALEQQWPGDPASLLLTQRSINLLLDLDLAMIEDAYQSAYLARQQRAERLATIGQMAGGVAHELRNPLNVVRTSVYYLLNAQCPTTEKVREHLERIERQVRVADSVISALADFARLPLPIATRFSIDTCLREVLEQNPLPAHVSLAYDCPSDLRAGMGDARQLQIVFSNLVRNAVEAMSGGGRLSIEVRQGGQELLVRVSDTGTGIADEDLERIMEPLFTTKARGIGLGLAISRSIVEKHAGRLQVTSKLGQGSTFSVALPVAFETTGGSPS